MGSDWRLFNCLDESKGSDSDNASANPNLLEAFLSQRPERTVAGAAIGSARDIISPGADGQEKLERAKDNDMAAHFVADTFAIVPKFKAVTGGIARATLLADPHLGLLDNAGDFGKNFLEGAALNKVGKSMLPGSALNRFTTSTFGKGLMAESALHTSMGFGFGAIKAGFEPTSWQDRNGNFTFSGGAASILESGTIGAAVNLPAGLLGMRVARGTLSLVPDGRLSQRTASIIAGSTSGYSGGAVFGAVDAQMRGLGFEETLSHMHFAGKTGALTGAFVSSFDYSKHLSRYANLSEARAMRAHESGLDGRLSENSLGKSARISESQRPASDQGSELSAPARRVRFNEMAQLTEREIGLMRFNNPDQAAVDSAYSRMRQRGTDIVETYRLRKDAPENFKSWDDFIDHTAPRELNVRVYEVDGLQAKIMVKESYARLQDRARAVRELAREEIPFDFLDARVRADIGSRWKASTDRLGLLQEYMGVNEAKQSLYVIEARNQISGTKLGKIMPMEEFVAAIEQLPDKKLVRSLLVLDEQSPQDPWLRLTHRDPKHVTQADASRDGRITFYLDENSSLSRARLNEVMRHEWSHLIDNQTPDESMLFLLASRTDKSVAPSERIVQGEIEGRIGLDKHHHSKYATTNDAENLAVHLGEVFLSPDVDSFLILGQQAPVRTSVLARFLMKGMIHAGSDGRSPHNQEFWKRVQYVEDVVLPKAGKILEARTISGNPQERAMSAELLGYLGDAGKNSAGLRKLISSELAGQVVAKADNGGIDYAIGAKRANPALDGRTIGEVAFDALARMSSRGSREQHFDFLLSEAAPGSSGRPYALKALESASDARGPEYARFMRLAGDPESLPELVTMMKTMSDARGRELIFNEVMSLGKDSPEFQQSIIREALAREPSLRARALEMVPIKPDPRMEAVLGKLSRQRWDVQSAKRADEILTAIRAESAINEAMPLLGSRHESQQLRALDLLTGIDDFRVVKPLLLLRQNGSELASSKASALLDNFSPTLVKFYARELGRSGAAIDINSYKR